MSSAIDLTILIPVYNGATYLRGLLDSFATYIEHDPASQQFRECCELIVVNNRSEDDTLDIANSYRGRISNLRVVTPDTHVPSAEENVFRSFGLARGEYTWVLGCDDIVRFEALPEVIRTARAREYDIAIFNCMQSDKDGRIESVCNYYMREKAYEGDLISLTQRMGYWWLIAGFSGQIVRTALVVGFDHAALVKATSPIYSHVTAYLLCLAGHRAAVLNVQNVIYRLSDNDPDHWKRAAATFGVFDEYFWTLGYIRQVNYLETRGIVGRDFLVKMIESNRSGFFRPTVVIYEKLAYQLELMTTGRSSADKRNVVARQDFEELCKFFEERDLLARPFLIACRQMYKLLESGKVVSERDFDEIKSRLASYRASFLLSANFVASEGDYEVYRLASTFYGVHRFFRGALLDRIRYLDHGELKPILFAGESIDEVLLQISEQGVHGGWDDVPASLLRYCSQSARHGALAWPAQISEKDSLTPFSTNKGTSLAIAQQELTAIYKARHRPLTRLAAWGAVLWLKLVKRLHFKKDQAHAMHASFSRETQGDQNNSATSVRSNAA